MCSPTLALTAVAVGFQAMSSIQQGNAASATAKANQQVQQQNVVLNDRAAVDSEQRGADAAAMERQKAREANASLRVRNAGAGLLTDTGSSGALQDQNTGTGELNALTVANNAEREAYGYRVQSTSASNQANIFGATADNARTAGLLGAGTALVTGAANYGLESGLKTGTKYGPNNSWYARNVSQF